MIRHSSSHIQLEDFDYIGSLVQRNFVGGGGLCDSFARALAKRYERTYCLLTGSGTAALEIALHELRSRRPAANEVIVGAYVCPAVVSAIIREGLRPVFADVQENSLNIDADAVARMIDESTVAVIMTHVGGIADPVSDILALDVPVISDCAQALGSTWKGGGLTAYGMAATTSFGSTKMLAAGSGGALFTEEADWFESAKRYSTEELSVEDYIEAGFVPTYGQHISDLTAGLGLAQLQRFESTLARRREIASRYTGLLSCLGGIELPVISKECAPNYFRYYFFSSSASEWLKLFKGKGVDARSSISHDMTKYFSGGFSAPNLVRNTQRLVSLPIHAALSEEDIEHVLVVIERGIASGLR